MPDSGERLMTCVTVCALLTCPLITLQAHSLPTSVNIYRYEVLLPMSDWFWRLQNVLTCYALCCFLMLGGQAY